ncbi:MAG: ribulose-phosphate 3-epimerase [Rikenellaceae bacterium]
MKIVSPSLLSADFLNLSKDIEMLNRSEAEWFHLDIMDGVFVPNISFGFPIVEKIRKATDKVLDLHLMIVEPERYIEQFAKAGADFLTVHVEASVHLHRTLSHIRNCGMKCGVALNPHTPLSSIEEVICDTDMILLMSVNPGFGGQSFIEATLDKVKRLKAMIEKSGSKALIQVDGGVNFKNYEAIFEAGADVLVAGNAVFSSENPELTIKQICGK